MNKRIIHMAAFVLGLVVLLTSAYARQDSSTAGFSSGGDIGLRVSAIGLGNRARPGDWTAIQVDVLHRSSNPKPMAVVVRTDIPNDDGDRAKVERIIVTNPNRPVTTWLYVRLPFNFDQTSTLTFSAFLPYDPEAGADSLGAYDPTKPIGSLTLTTQALISQHSGLIGIVGRRTAAIDRYAERVGTSTSSDVPITGHELTVVADGILPASMPDRVHGLRSFEAIVWTGTAPEEQPSRLSTFQADSIREWIAGGGHLVIVLPVVGQTWIDTPNPLSDIMPKVHAERREGVSLDKMRYLLTTKKDAPLPPTTIMHAFMPDPSAGPFDATPIFLTDKGEIVVVRRQVGIGAVTLVGIDATQLANLTVLRPDAFWNRILGKRLELPTRKEYDDLMNANQILGAFNRSDEYFEKSIGASVNWESRAAVGLLVAVVVFSGFWLIAGPVGFFVLKQRQRTQHSWLAYAAAIAAFTAVSWGAATVMRQRTPEIKHITMIDHVYGQPCQRARVWANVFLPSYGSTEVSVVNKPFDLAGRPLEPHPAIAAWETPGVSSGGSEFPESRTYVVDARSPDKVDFPSRSTTRHVQVDWLGSPQLKMPIPQVAGGQVPMGEELKLAVETPQGPVGKWTVNGTLQHDLPGPLNDVVIIVNRGQLPIAPLRGGALTSDAGIFQLTKPWAPGEPLVLDEATKHGNDPAIRAESYLERICPRTQGSAFAGMGGQLPNTKEEFKQAKAGIVTNLIQLSLYSMLAPPNVRQNGDNRCNARRATAHTLDLGRWFTEPCVIVIGFLGNGKDAEGNDCPVPIHVDGQEIPSGGITCVRWVYPLKAAAPEYNEIEASLDPTGPLNPTDGNN